MSRGGRVPDPADPEPSERGSTTVHDHPQTPNVFPARHDHVFLGERHDRNVRRTWVVIALTASMMVVEIAGGTIFGSMALVADGWHMSTHAAALLITALAYRFARRHSADRRFTFGTGKIGDLAGFASAVILAIVALLIGWESLVRLANPVPISFAQAISVAVVGLIVNLLCAWILEDDHDDHDHDHDHGHVHVRGRGQHAQDNNIRGAYLHVLADAMTSVLAIVSLVAGSFCGWIWLDPAIGILGALVIARWSWGLVQDAGAVLLDVVPEEAGIPEEIRRTLARRNAEIEDLHVWQVGPGHHAAIVSLRGGATQNVREIKADLAGIAGLSHLTVELA
jgi:cation diffusion facilitator family transporter